MHIQKQALHAKNLKKITDIGLHNYGGDAGNTLQYVLKSFTDAQQQRQHGEKQAFNKDKQWNGNEAMHIKQPCTRKIWKKNNGHCASQVRWRRRKYIALCSKIIYKRATDET